MNLTNKGVGQGRRCRGNSTTVGLIVSITLSIVAIVLLAYFIASHPTTEKGLNVLIDAAQSAKSIFYSTNGSPVTLDATLIIRLPEKDQTGQSYSKQQMDEFAGWIHTTYQGCTRWEVESSVSASQFERRMVYMVGLNKEMSKKDVPGDVGAEAKRVFGNTSDILFIEITHPHIEGVPATAPS